MTNIYSDLGLTPEDVSLIGTFRNFINSRGANPNSVLGSALQRQADPLFATFAFQNALGAGGAGNANARFTNFLGQGGNPNQQAANIFGQLGQGGSFANLPEFQNVLQGAAPGTDIGGALENLARSGLRSKLSGSVASLFGNSLINSAQGGYEQNLAGAATGGSLPRYDQYLAQRLGF